MSWPNYLRTVPIPTNQLIRPREHGFPASSLSYLSPLAYEQRVA